MKKYLIIVSILFCVLCNVYADKPDSVLTKEIQLIADNDSFLFRIIDRYYSSGLYAHIRFLRYPDQLGYQLFPNPKFKKSIFYAGLNHQMYTPYDVGEYKLYRIDRPYAGWLYADMGMDYYYQKSVLNGSVDLGWVGPATQTDHLQIWLHDVLNSRTPRGWRDFQIDDHLSFHLNLGTTRQIISFKNLDILAEIQGKIGTVRTNVTAGFCLRMGLIKPLYESAYKAGKLGSPIYSKDNKKNREFYLSIKSHWTYVVHDLTIQGAITGNERKNWQPETFIRSHAIGLISSGLISDFILALNYMTKDASTTQHHYFVTIGMSRRFR